MANHLPKPQPSKPAFVLGNGISRLNADLPSLKQYGVVYGCNALYREFQPDHLIAVDVKMVNEIITAGYNKQYPVWTNPNKGVVSLDFINVLNPHKGWSSGPTALWLATQYGHKEIYILGFDYEGLRGKVNNVYAGTNNYKGKDMPATFFGNWSAQTEKVIRENKDVKFYRVLGDSKFIPPNFREDMTNIAHISYAELEVKYPRFR